jgi:hypothetical protein
MLVSAALALKLVSRKQFDLWLFFVPLKTNPWRLCVSPNRYTSPSNKWLVLLPRPGQFYWTRSICRNLGYEYESIGVGTATGYGLDDRGFGVWFSVGWTSFLLHVAQTHQSPFNGHLDTFRGVKLPECEADHSPPLQYDPMTPCLISLAQEKLCIYFYL